MRRWHSPEELVEIGLSQNRVLMVNEAHDYSRRCVRTRRLGGRLTRMRWAGRGVDAVILSLHNEMQ